LIPQSRNCSCEIRGGQWFGKHEGCKRISIHEDSHQLLHIWRDGDVGKLIVAEAYESEGSQTRREVEVTQLIFTKAEEVQFPHVCGQAHVRQLIAEKEKCSLVCRVCGHREAGELIESEI